MRLHYEPRSKSIVNALVSRSAARPTTAQAVDAATEAHNDPAPRPARAQRGPRSRRCAPAGLPPEQAAARERMITQHLPLVRYVAGSLTRNKGQSVLLEYDDLVSYGTEGLIGAVDTFDPEREVAFCTWAV